jgi:MtN3 and saliva related transmembrane protein
MRFGADQKQFRPITKSLACFEQVYGMNSFSQYVGIGAGILTGLSLLPQLFKLIRERKANFSISMLIVLMAGLAGWVWYGILKEDYPIIITNSFSLLTNITILILAFVYKRKDHNV